MKLIYTILYMHNSLRPMVHDRELPVVSAAMRKNFVTRMLFLDIYYHRVFAELYISYIFNTNSTSLFNVYLV